MLAQKLPPLTKNAIKPGKSAFLVIDMYESLTDVSSSCSGKSKLTNRVSNWIRDTFTYSNESVVAQTCKTIQFGKSLGIETFVITYGDSPIDKKILEAAGYPKVINKYDMDVFLASNLKQHLKERSIENVIVSGYHREECVFHSVQGAAKNGFGVIVANPLTLSESTRYAYSETTEKFKQIADVCFTISDLHKLMHKLSISYN